MRADLPHPHTILKSGLHETGQFMSSPHEDTTPTSRTLRWIALTALTLLVIWIAGGFLLVMFAGVLVAIMLKDLGNRLARATSLSESAAVMAVTLTLIVLAGLICW